MKRFNISKYAVHQTLEQTVTIRTSIAAKSDTWRNICYYLYTVVCCHNCQILLQNPEYNSLVVCRYIYSNENSHIFINMISSFDAPNLSDKLSVRHSLILWYLVTLLIIALTLFNGKKLVSKLVHESCLSNGGVRVSRNSLPVCFA